MFKKIVGVKVNRKQINGKPVKVFSIMKKPGIKDFARAAAAASPVMSPFAIKKLNGKYFRNNFGPWDETVGSDNTGIAGDYSDEPWLGGTSQATDDYSDEPWLGGSSQRSSKSSTSKSNGTGKLWDFLTDVGGSAISKLAKSDATAGKGVGNILAGLGEDYIRDCVRRYKAGESMSEFDRRVAMAAIELENAAKKKGKSIAGEWIMDHLPEIGFGVLALIVLITIIAKK